MKKWSQNKGKKEGKQGGFTCNYIFLRFEIISLITKFRKHLRGSVIFNKAAGLQLQLQ